jgi:hypothetical protein
MIFELKFSKVAPHLIDVLLPLIMMLESNGYGDKKVMMLNGNGYGVREQW